MRLQLSSLAQQDLAKISTYIAKTLHNPIAAHNTTAGIFKLLVRLAEFPKLGSVLPLPNSGNIEIRYVVYRNYLITYIAAADHVEVVRILYARSDYIKLLGA